MDYGADDFYTGAMERALDGWRAWNAALGEELFHETGAMFVTRDADAARRLRARQLRDARAARASPRATRCAPRSSRGLSLARSRRRLLQPARRLGRERTRGRAAVGARARRRRRRRRRTRATRVTPTAGHARVGRACSCDAVVVAAGGWVPSLVPEIAACFRTVGSRCSTSRRRTTCAFPVFGADIARTGWYGFPRHPDGFVKVANHGVGPRDARRRRRERVVTREDEARAARFPARVAARRSRRRRSSPRALCVYCDTARRALLDRAAPRRAEPRRRDGRLRTRLQVRAAPRRVDRARARRRRGLALSLARRSRPRARRGSGTRAS